MKVVFNWAIFVLISLGIFNAIRFRHYIASCLPALPTMTGLQAIGFGFACAFMWVEVMKIGVMKPFNCLKCMTGWLTLIIALMFHVEFWPFYLPVGLTAGAVFEAIKLRWL